MIDKNSNVPKNINEAGYQHRALQYVTATGISG